MKAVGKIFKIILLLTFIISAILISASFVLKDKVAEIVQSTINRNISTKIDVGSFRFSLLKKFPKASLELRNVSILSSPGFEKEAFPGIDTDTLLVAESMSLDFKSTDIVRKKYDIKRINIRNGKISLYTDASGKVNYKIAEAKINSDTGRFSLNLRRIILTDIKVIYNNLSTKFLVYGEIKDGKLSSRISGDNIYLNSETDLRITSIQLNNSRIKSPFNASLELEMEDINKSILFRKGILSVEGFHFGISGIVSPETDLDLRLEGEKIDLSKIKKYLPEELFNTISDYNFSGNLQIESQITGRLTNTSNPHIESICTLVNGGVSYSKTGLSIRNISLNGTYSNGSRNCQETSTVSARDIKGIIGTADFNGNLIIRNFTRPTTQIELKSRIIPGELKQFFRLNNILTASGYFDLDMKLKTDYWPEDSISFNEIFQLKPEGTIKFNSLNYSLTNSKLSLNDINGELFLSSSILAKNLRFVYKNQKIAVNGEFVNLPEWIAGNPVKLKADADIHFDRLIPETITSITLFSDDKSKKAKAFSMPDDMFLNINFKIDSLKEEKLLSSDIAVTLIYKPGSFTFNSLNMKSLNGTISGNGFIIQNGTESFMVKGSFNISDLNINKTFSTFRNFGQSFIKAENLEGKLTGSLTLLLPFDSSFKPQIKSLIAEGKYIITDGALIDFEPVKELSSFIELSELEIIHFKKLENDFFIRNNFVYIPQMDVSSSAADLSINGKHSFDNSFEYHVKIKLSEFLSKKRKKAKSNITEFGVVEDDGLGRTSLLLKVGSKGDEIKVGYDVKAAGNKVKTSIKSERQTLKTILNQEYGLYKADTLPTQKPSEKKPRFRITWDESDTIKKEPDPGSVKKENALKSLLKKK